MIEVEREGRIEIVRGSKRLRDSQKKKIKGRERRRERMIENRRGDRN